MGDDPKPLAQLLRQPDQEKATTSIGRRRELTLRTHPQKRYLPQVERDIERIEPLARAVFRRLTKGEIAWPLYLFGDVGTGKTCAALVLCDLSKSAWYATADNLVDWMAKGWQDDMAAVRKIEAIGAHEVAVLDELGTHQPKLFAANGDGATELHCKAVKDFYERREMVRQSGTIYVANVPPESLKDVYDDRIASRLLSGTQFKLQDVDRRHHKVSW